MKKVVILFVVGLIVLLLVLAYSEANRTAEVSRFRGEVEATYYKEGQDSAREAVEVARPFIPQTEYGNLCYESGRVGPSRLFDEKKALDPYQFVLDVGHRLMAKPGTEKERVEIHEKLKRLELLRNFREKTKEDVGYARLNELKAEFLSLRQR